MPVPTYREFIEPILRILGEHPDGVRAHEVHDLAAERLGLTAEDMDEVLPSGVQPVYKNRAGWAHDRLKRAGLSSSPRRGFWQLTDAGRAWLAQHSGPLTSQELWDFSHAHKGVRLRGTDQPPATRGSADHSVAHADDIEQQSPDDRLESALQEIRDSVAAELLDTIVSATPKFFEGMVLDLLHAMGYGANRRDVRRVGGSGDGGIDGVISLDRLGLEKVYVQAKRWQNAVGRPEIQAFYGALAGQRATKGVFITTATFSKQAIEFAQSVGSIVLVDGEQMALLMIEHGVGVSHRALRVPKVDSDYFD